MPRPFATIDTSVLLSLQSAGLLGAVSVLFDKLLVPSAVRKELKEGGERNAAAIDAVRAFAIFENCDDFDSASVQLLLDTRAALKAGRDRGEAEAVIQAAQRSASMALIDDKLGRDWAERHSIECHGTVWVCRELRRTGYLAALRPYFVLMLADGRRLPLNSINRYLGEFGEPVIVTRV